MPTESGYSNQKKKGTAQFKTIQNLGGGKHGTSNAVKVLYEITASTALVSVSDVLGPDGQVEFWNIQFTAHGAALENVLRLTASNYEYEIVRIINANNFYILPVSDVKPTSAMSGSILGWVTQKASSTGETSVAITSAPTQYTYDGSPQTVVEDTSVYANNRALPIQPFIYKDGIQVPVTVDTAVEANNIPFPVDNSMSVSGMIALDFASTNVDDSAWVQISAGIGALGCKKAQIFMSSGPTLILGVGAAGFETPYAYITPGGNGLIDFKLPPSVRLSVIAFDTVTVDEGQLFINLIG